MSPDALRDYLGTPGFAERVALMRGRVEAGEPMTLEHLAHGLGLPFAFLAECLARKIIEMAPEAVVTISGEREEIH